MPYLSRYEWSATNLRGESVKALNKVGFYFKRQEGSHIVLRRSAPLAQVVVPDHKELDRATLRAIIKAAGLGVDEFKKLL
jgi:predicted RNA binding protein YcfA (HicA-like mRNA interferase family)